MTDIKETSFDRAFASLWRAHPTVPFLDLIQMARSMAQVEEHDDE